MKANSSSQKEEMVIFLLFFGIIFMMGGTIELLLAGSQPLPETDYPLFIWAIIIFFGGMTLSLAAGPPRRIWRIFKKKGFKSKEFLSRLFFAHLFFFTLGILGLWWQLQQFM